MTSEVKFATAEPALFDLPGHRFRLTFWRMLARGFGSNSRPQTFEVEHAQD
jgi:hypothetical protein